MSDTKPIIMSGPMVKAILDGRKTQTRRVLKPQPWRNDVGQWLWERRAGQHIPFHPGLPREHYGTAGIPAGLPYAPGQLLWVRETWRLGRGYDGAKIADAQPFARVWYEADESNDNADAIGMRVRPSIHMPRWASRLTLEVTDVRVQRVQEISEEDAVAEGVEREVGLDGRWRDYGAEHVNIRWAASPRESFCTLWDSLNAKRGYGWDRNPWVCAISFEANEASVDDLLREAAA